MLGIRIIGRRLSSFVNKEAAALVPRFEKIVGSENVKTTTSARELHSHDESHHTNKLPDVVIIPHDKEQISAVMKLCNESRVPVVPYGAGSGFEGGVNAVAGGVCFDMMEMNEVIAINAEDFDCIVQPGVTRKQLNAKLHDTGLFFPVDPGADASICAMAATCASGTNAVRYGTMRQNVVNLEVVLADGDIIYTAGYRRRTRKSSAGYNLTSLFVGSEGTLGVFTEAVVRLHARPTCLSAAVCSFPSVHEAINAVVTILQCSIPMAKIEFMDKEMLAACNKFSHLELPEQPTLFLEFDGNTEDELKYVAEFVGGICSDNAGSDFKWSHLPEEMEELWTARHNAYYSILAERKGCKGFSTDVCVPISKLADVIVETRKDIDETGMIGGIVGHVGDGNFHCMFPVDRSNDDEMKVIWGISDRVVKRALAVGGTCTGEHGIGLGKREYMKGEFGETTVNAMKALKRALDPNWIMNPGKIFN